MTVHDPTSKFIDAECDGHRVTGYARLGRGSGYFDVPLFTKVAEGFWQGGTPAQAPYLAAKFDKILCLYPWERYNVPETTEKVEVEMYDDVEQGFEQVEQLSDLVENWISDENQVLVHCQAGLNRSSLVTAIALMKLYGWDGEFTINHLRTSRCDQVLCNTAFEEYILDWEEGI